MSWASIYWDLDHIVQAAREAMESAYAAEAALSHALTISHLPAAVPIAEDLNAQADNISNVDPLRIAEIVLSIEKPADAAIGEKVEDHSGAPIDSLEVSLRRSSLESKTLAADTSNFQPRSPWTPEIEAALREFLRPLSISLRYEYRFPDTLDEKRSIETINSLFRQRAHREDLETLKRAARLSSQKKC